MMDTDGVSVAGHSTGRRKRLQLSREARILKRNERYKLVDPNLRNWKIPCQHNKKKIYYQCCEIDINTLKVVKNYFFKDYYKNNQNMRLVSLLKIENPKRDRNRHADTYKPHDLQIQYTIRQNKNCYDVCRTFFQKLFEITPRMILSVAKKIKKGENVAVNSGGDRRSHKQAEKFEKLKSFIGKFRAQESHYTRNKSKRLYLHSSLTIRKMWRMYDNEVDDGLKVTYGYFHKIFSTQFNLGFGSPATDVCSYCERIKYQIKNNPQENDLKRDLDVHKFKAKQFTLLMREERENEVTYCFDLQQVQNLPKLPVQEAFYSLQIAFYCFCVVDRHAQNPHFYVWTEDVSGRGSNEIGSAVLHFLRNSKFDESITKIRLFCDGCGGQNKNSHMLHVLMYWLHNESPNNITEIQLTFPVRGHSYLPVDRVEKELRRNDKIILPLDYINIYNNFGKVYELGKDWRVYDLKALLSVFNKYDGISEQKIISIKKVQNRKTKTHEVTIIAQVFYRNDDPSKKPKTLLKRGKSMKTASLKPITEKHKISPDKAKAVNNLLIAAFGKECRLDEKLKWYFELLIGDFQTVEEIEMENTEQEENCDCVQEEPELKT